MNNMFWVSIYTIVYVYIGYPLLLLILDFFIKRPIKKAEIIPFVSLIISAYNEEKVIEEKLENCLRLDYPKQNLEVIVASDGSDDNTDNIVRNYEKKGVKLFSFPMRKGKTFIQNESVKKALGEIIVFSDANSIYSKDAIKKIVQNFHDKNIGGVCGELRYNAPDSNAAGKSENLYWVYEKFLKSYESKIHSVLGANGSIYAIRRDLYESLKENLISDFVEPLKIIEKGYRVCYEKNAISYEKASESFLDEFRRKVRILARSYYGLWYLRCMLNPLKHGIISFELISHKILRWFIFIPLVALFIANLFLQQNNYFYSIFFVLQLIFYNLAFIRFLQKNKAKTNKILDIPLYFCLVNFAGLVALLRFLKGEKNVVWKTVRK